MVSIGNTGMVVVAVCSTPGCGSDVCAMPEDRADVWRSLPTWGCQVCGGAWLPAISGEAMEVQG